MNERVAPADSVFGPSSFDRTRRARPATRFIGWRLRLLVLAALVGCVGGFALMRWLAASNSLDASFEVGPAGTLVLGATRLPMLQDRIGQALVAVQGADGVTVPLDASALRRSGRWEPDDARRRRLVGQQEDIAAAFARGDATLEFGDGGVLRAPIAARGYGGLGLGFAPLAALAMLLYLIGVVVVLVKPQPRNLLYLAMVLAQAGNLLFVALASMPGLGLPPGAMRAEVLPRTVFDLVTAAAAVHAFALHPRRLPRAGAIAGCAWGVAAVLALLAASGTLQAAWWWTQAAVLALGAAAVAVVDASYRGEANPFAAVLRRFAIVALATLLLVTAGTGVANDADVATQAVAQLGATVWTVFFASLLLLVPFLARSKQLLREFALLAGISTVATSLDLLFVALFSFSAFTSLTLAVFIAIGIYAAARQRILNRVVGSTVLTTERTFEQLYRAARAVRDEPQRHAVLLAQLLRDLFEPLETLPSDRPLSQPRVVGAGSVLVVPVRPPDDAAARPAALVLRHAYRGKRLFTSEDARLAGRIVEQLRRAVAYDRAVERGRNEERLRIAQDLHDDIGARLLTLMYKAQSPEMEDYVRHTLADLKTLTRGLAAAEHRLSHAAGEWKADLTQRLAAAHMRLDWSFETDRDVQLSVVQWSALTRVLRELTSNAISHAQASRLDIAFRLVGRELTLSVADDGRGHSPEGWSHGLGLGGVRKRVKLLGGSVRWRENRPRGVVCDVAVPDFVPRPAADDGDSR